MSKLNKILYKNEASSQKAKRVLYKWGKVLALPAAISLLAVPITQYFHRKDGLEAFLEETVNNESNPIEKVITIEKGFQKFGVLEYLSLFESEDFHQAHEKVFDSYLEEMAKSGIAPEEIRERVNPHSALQMYFRALKNQGFGYERGSTLGRGVLDKKINCAIRSLMFLSDLNTRLGLPVYGVDIFDGEEGHALLRYDNGKTRFHFDPVTGRINNNLLLDNYSSIEPDDFLHVVLHNYAVTLLESVWHKDGNRYVLTNSPTSNETCNSALVINEVAQELAEDLIPANPRLHLTDSYIYLCLKDKESASDSFEEFLETREEVPWEDYNGMIRSFLNTFNSNP